MVAECLSLQLFGAFTSTEQVHAGLADRYHFARVVEGQPVHSRERILETDVMVGLVAQWQTVRPGNAAVTVQYGLIGVDGERRMHDTRVVEGHLDSGAEIRIFAADIDDPLNADGLRLCEQLIDRVHGHRRLVAFDGLPVHFAGEGDDARHMRVIVDDARVGGKRLRGWRPAAVAMVMLGHGFQSNRGRH